MVSTNLRKQGTVALAIPVLLVQVQHVIAGELSRALFESRYGAVTDPAAPQLPPASHYLSRAVRQSDHFVVWTRTHPRDAEWTVRVLETAWNDIGVLLDQCTPPSEPF